MSHPQMQVRLTTQGLPPWAVQDATCIVVEMGLSARDKQCVNNNGNPHIAAEMVLAELPHGVYAKVDKCNRTLLPTIKCENHATSGCCKDCPARRSFEGLIVAQTLCRQWTFTDPVTGFNVQVRRTHLPLMPETTCPPPPPCVARGHMRSKAGCSLQHAQAGRQ